MKKLLLIVFISFSALCLSAQTNIDSLWKVWSNESLIDTIRLEALYDYLRSDELKHYPDSANKLTQEMLAFAVDVNNRYYQGLAYNHIGDLCANKSDYSGAQKNYFKALNVIQESEGIVENDLLVSVHWGLASSFFVMGQYPNSIKHYLLVTQILKDLGRNTSGVLNNIGLIYKDQGDFDKAMDYFEESAKVAEEAGFSNAIAIGNIGRVHSEMGNYQEAIYYINKKIQLLDVTAPNYDCQMMSALAALGETYMKMKDHNQALDLLMQSLASFEKDSSLCNRYYDIERRIGSVYEDMGQWDLAIKWCTKGHNIAINKSLLPAQPLACDCLYKAYEGKGNYKKAFEYLELMNRLNDSLDREESIKSIQQMEFAKQMFTDSIATAEETRLVEEAHEEEVRQKNQTQNILLGSGSLLLLLVGGLYSRNRFIKRSRDIISKEKDRSENLLLNILPADIAEELKETGQAAARNMDMASILFTDFKGFTEASSKMSASDLVKEINEYFKAFDAICGKYQIEKIKTIGDAYMAAGGVPVATDDSVKNTVMAALEMQAFVATRKDENTASGKPSFEMRAGVHTGPVVAGIVGAKKFQYDIWGDAVNTASRMESSGEVGKVNISQATYELLKDDDEFTFESRGKIEAKGKGEIEMYFVSRA